MMRTTSLLELSSASSPKKAIPPSRPPSTASCPSRRSSQWRASSQNRSLPNLTGCRPCRSDPALLAPCPLIPCLLAPQLPLLPVSLTLLCHCRGPIFFRHAFHKASPESGDTKAIESQPDNCLSPRCCWQCRLRSSASRSSISQRRKLSPARLQSRSLPACRLPPIQHPSRRQSQQRRIRFLRALPIQRQRCEVFCRSVDGHSQRQPTRRLGAHRVSRSKNQPPAGRRGVQSDLPARDHPQTDSLNPNRFVEPSSAELWQAAGFDSARLTEVLGEFNQRLTAWSARDFRRDLRDLPPEISETEAKQLLRIGIVQSIVNARAYCRRFDDLTASQQMASPSSYIRWA